MSSMSRVQIHAPMSYTDIEMEPHLVLKKGSSPKPKDFKNNKFYNNIPFLPLRNERNKTLANKFKERTTSSYEYA